jgi:D-alanyl-lipoteichoic acid acyltransferase DltB (MBOAT superfamily)
MVFNSLQFAVFFLVVYVLYLVLPHRLQNRMLLVASYVFYGAWDWRFLSLIAISTVVDFYCGRAMQESSSESQRKRLLLVSITANLSMLGFFKYFGFFSESLAALFIKFGINLDPVTLNIVLPVGISFYTFQTLSYTIDIYRRDMRPCPNFLDFALFVAFFPQLVAGPIERAKHLIPQLTRPRSLSSGMVAGGIYLVVWGLFKKVVIADNLGIYVDDTFAKQGDFANGEVFVAVLAFAFQIYCDFSGYSDIARGLAKMLGIDLMLNFNLPYIARNPSDFWRRWHISLSTWLRDYLYLSLGGNRLGVHRTYINLIIVMLLGGLWHGAAWNFVFWGAYHGLLLAIHRAIRPRLDAITAGFGTRMKSTTSLLSIFFMFGLTLYGWLLFRVNGLDQIGVMTINFLPRYIDMAFLEQLAKVIFYASPLILMQALQIAKDKLEFVTELGLIPQTLFYLFCFYSIIIFGNFDGASFIYFQF